MPGAHAGGRRQDAAVVARFAAAGRHRDAAVVARVAANADALRTGVASSRSALRRAGAYARRQTAARAFAGKGARSVDEMARSRRRAGRLGRLALSARAFWPSRAAFLLGSAATARRGARARRRSVSEIILERLDRRDVPKRSSAQSISPR